MCAGIISACLPTLRPVVAAAASRLGLEHYMPFYRQTHSSNSNDPVQTIGERSSRSKNDGNTLQSDRGTSDAFYRLPDHSDLEDIMADTGHFDDNNKLRTESKLRRYKSTSIDTDEHSLATTEHDIAMERLR